MLHASVVCLKVQNRVLRVMVLKVCGVECVGKTCDNSSNQWTRTQWIAMCTENR